MTAWIGEPTDEYRAVCVYAPRPGMDRCSAPATVHILTDDDTGRWGRVAVASCHDHAPIARAAGNQVAEHTHGGVCGLPSTIWHLEQNRCVIDDSGQEPAARAGRAPNPVGAAVPQVHAAAAPTSHHP